MHYCIDFDSRRVELKSEHREDLEKYVLENDLELAVAVISSEDELCLTFSLEEMGDIYFNLCGNTTVFPDEDSAASATWKALEDNDLPLKASLANARKIEPKSDRKPKVEKSTSTSRTKFNMEDELIIVDDKCKIGSIMYTIVKAINEDMCVTIGEVAEYIVSNHKVADGSLADEKYAKQKIRDLIKMNKLRTEEGL